MRSLPPGEKPYNLLPTTSNPNQVQLQHAKPLSNLFSLRPVSLIYYYICPWIIPVIYSPLLTPCNSAPLTNPSTPPTDLPPYLTIPSFFKIPSNPMMETKTPHDPSLREKYSNQSALSVIPAVNRYPAHQQYQNPPDVRKSKRSPTLPGHPHEPTKPIFHPRQTHPVSYPFPSYPLPCSIFPPFLGRRDGKTLRAASRCCAREWRTENGRRKSRVLVYGRLTDGRRCRRLDGLWASWN